MGPDGGPLGLGDCPVLSTYEEVLPWTLSISRTAPNGLCPHHHRQEGREVQANSQNSL